MPEIGLEGLVLWWRWLCWLHLPLPRAVLGIVETIFAYIAGNYLGRMAKGLHVIELFKS